MIKSKRKKRKRKSRYKRGIHISPKSQLACSYRSGWELLYLHYLDADESVSSYQYEQLKIPYISNKKTGKLRNYLPDFLVIYIDGSSKIIEIKPKRKLLQATVVKKLKAAQEWCLHHNMTLEVITEIELRQLGLLK